MNPRMVKDTLNPDRLRYMEMDGHEIDLDSQWRRINDGAVYEVVWMQDWRGPRLQLRRYGLANMKSTHWLDPESLIRLYEPVAPRDA